MISFFVPGKPVGKERPRLGKSGNVYTPSKTKDWEHMIGLIANEHFRDSIFEDEVGVALFFFLRGKRGDIDNLAKSVLDGLQGVAYKNDSQVYILFVQKIRVNYENDEGVEINIWDLKKDDLVIKAKHTKSEKLLRRV